ncbi:MAG: hypothetical protein AB8B55_17940 [Mariniblastus sp.]
MKPKPNKRKFSKRTSESIGGQIAESTNAQVTAFQTSGRQELTVPLGSRWSSTSKRVVSVLIAAWLVVVVLGPLSNPISSPYFSQPLAETVAPLHQAFYLDNGYRFFAPDPTASHILIYEGVREDGTTFSGRIPDRKTHSPRLLYHRWFMLSETLFSQHFLKPTQVAFDQRSKEYDRQLQSLIKSNEMDLHRQLSADREIEIQQFENAKRRVEKITASVAQALMDRNRGTSIQLFVTERGIPFPEQVRRGVKLNDPSLLAPKLKIGQLSSDGFQLFELQAKPEPAQ